LNTPNPPSVRHCFVPNLFLSSYRELYSLTYGQHRYISHETRTFTALVATPKFHLALLCFICHGSWDQKQGKG